MQVLLHAQNAVRWPRTQNAALINLEMVNLREFCQHVTKDNIVLRKQERFSKGLSFDTIKATSVPGQLLSQCDSIANVLANSRMLNAESHEPFSFCKWSICCNKEMRVNRVVLSLFIYFIFH